MMVVLNNITLWDIAIYVPSICVVFSILSIIKKYLSDIVDLKRMTLFKDFEAILEFYYNKAYSTIYKDQILVFSVEGLSPKEEDIKKIQHMYLDLFRKLCGEWLMKQFFKYYGDNSTIYCNALAYFDNQYENDAVRESAINNQIDLDQGK